MTIKTKLRFIEYNRFCSNDMIYGFKNVTDLTICIQALVRFSFSLIVRRKEVPTSSPHI